MLEPCDAKVSSTVLRGLGDRKVARLLGNEASGGFPWIILSETDRVLDGLIYIRACQEHFSPPRRRRGFDSRHPAPLAIEDTRLVSCPWVIPSPVIFSGGGQSVL